jgi:hypothetical protein
MFFTKQNKIIVDCFVVEPIIHDLFSIQKTSKFYPEWWKQLPNSYVSPNSLGETGTMKGCPGFTDLFTNSFTVPMWSDFKLRVDDQKHFVYQFADQKTGLVLHDRQQREGLMPTHEHIKFIAPWQVVSKHDVKFVVMQPIWNQNGLEQFITPPGMVNFKYQHNVNINLFFKPDTPGVYTFEAGQPILTIVPLTEKKVEFKTHLVSESEWMRINNIHSQIKFSDKYKFIKRNYEKGGKCPFVFGSKK